MAEYGVVTIVFLLSGVVKGVIGIGLPTLPVAILAAVMGLDEAIAISLLPSIASNLWQAISGGVGMRLLQRLWPFFIPAAALIPIGAMALNRIDLNLLSGLLGLALTIYACSHFAGFRLHFTHRAELLIGPLSGLLNGLLSGMTGSYVVPGVMFLQSLGLKQGEFIQAMGILFSLSSVVLLLSLGTNNTLDGPLFPISLLACVPVGVGMMMGQRLRGMMSLRFFTSLTMGCLMVLGLYLVAWNLVELLGRVTA